MCDELTYCESEIFPLSFYIMLKNIDTSFFPICNHKTPFFIHFLTTSLSPQKLNLQLNSNKLNF